jgi:hypothetical protein
MEQLQLSQACAAENTAHSAENSTVGHDSLLCSAGLSSMSLSRGTRSPQAQVPKEKLGSALPSAIIHASDPLEYPNPGKIVSREHAECIYTVRFGSLQLQLKLHV